MNYIKHINNFFRRSATDARLCPGHISLYMAIFQQWNHHRFKDYFTINRKDLMQLSKVRSKDTYHKYIRELHEAGYIHCYPSVIRGYPPEVSVPRLDLLYDKHSTAQADLFTSVDNDAEPAENGTEPVPDTDAGSPENGTEAVLKPGHIYKQTNSKPETFVLETPTLMEVSLFFKENNYPVLEAKKFWYYNESKHWLLADGQLIRQWEPLAHKWMLSVPAGGHNAGPGVNPGIDGDKNYNEPL